MRRWLYGMLAALATVTAIAVAVTEVTKGQCTIVCAWQIPLLVVGVGAACAFVAVAGWTIVYELGRAAWGGRRP